MSDPFQPRFAFALLLAAALVALGTALGSQFLGGLQPCVLCLWQRIPWAVVVGLAGLGIGLSRVRGINPLVPALLLALVALALLVNVGIAGFHVGVEQHWWEGTKDCTGGGTATTAAELRRQLLGTAPARCDQPAWTMFGISMAGYDLVACAIVGVFAWIAARRAWPGR